MGMERKEILGELSVEVDPFNMERVPVDDFVAAYTGGSPFAGLSSEDLDRFVKSVKADFMLMYPRLAAKPIRVARRRDESDIMI